MGRSFSAYCIHPLLLAAAPVLLLAAHNSDQVALGGVVGPVALAVIAAAMVLLLTRLVVGDWGKAAVISSIFVVAFFTYGHMHSAIAALQLTTRTRLIHYLLLPTYFVLMVGGAWFVYRAKLPNLGQFSRALTTLSVMLCGIAVVQLAYGHLQHMGAATDGAVRARSSDDEMRARLDVESLNGKELPDIYYIILDGYARADVLERVFGFDNTEFLNALKDRGVFVAEESASNYMMTYVSLASSLNMRYVQPDVEDLPERSKDRAALHAILWDNNVSRILHDAGYEVTHFKTNFTGTERSDNADVMLPETATEFQMILGATTLLKPALSLGLVPYYSGPTGGYLYHYIFDAIEEMQRGERPRFVFAHLICPHPPALVNRNGGVVRRAEVAGFEAGNTRLWKDHDGYLQQIEFCNSRILQIIDQHLSKSDTPPIIIIQADHGSCSLLDESIDPQQQTDFIDERVAILNAMLVPDEIRKHLYPGITPVNTFRILLRELLDLDVEPLDDRVYFSWYNDPYDFVDVTNRTSVGPEVHATTDADASAK